MPGSIGVDSERAFCPSATRLLPRVNEVFQAKPERQEEKALLAEWEFQENKETLDLKDNQ